MQSLSLLSRFVVICYSLGNHKNSDFDEVSSATSCQPLTKSRIFEEKILVDYERARQTLLFEGDGNIRKTKEIETKEKKELRCKCVVLPF